ncbi:MAG TPA: hydroxymethylbilane synthase [Candidatus Acidoferrales bacterium]|nr:hydroxymethylbilane synthase [Candidatus Acidoferrales bacterium]
MRPLRIGTRGSALALWQANAVLDRLARDSRVEAEIVVIKTLGDRFQQAPVGQIGLKGVFIKELEDALLEGRVDLAVHSMKDVPTETPAGLAFPAICEREDPRDALVTRTGAKLAELVPGARVGTSSLRRQSQLRHYRPDLDLRDLRGNVDTRLKKLDRGDYDAVVLAKAGLDRLGWSQRINEVLSTEVSLPAVGQGALGIEARADDREALDAVTSLDHAQTRDAVAAERALLAELEGGCQVPLGAWARLEGSELVLEACILSADGADYIRRRAAGSRQHAEALGRELAQAMLAAGADRILKLAGRNVGRH